VPRISESERRTRKDQILAAAAVCFTANGFHATSMDAIAAEAGMSPGGLYRHFPSKASLITATADDIADALGEIARSARASGHTSPHDLVIAVVTAADALAGTRGRLALHIWAEAQRDPSIAALAAAQIHRLRGQLEDVLADDPAFAGEDRGAAASVLFATVTGYLVQKLIADVSLDSFVEGIDQVFVQRGA
jgi:AcrR family transcriptional regulator